MAKRRLAWRRMGCVGTMICEQGDIISINFDPSKRHEPAGRHYAIVISPWHINMRSSLTLLAPVTSTDNGYPLHIKIASGNEIEGFVQCEALRAMDLGVRETEKSIEVVGALDDDTLSQILSCILVVLGIDEL